jgi:hypothetical protein
MAMVERTENGRTLLTENGVAIGAAAAAVTTSQIIKSLKPNFELQNRRISVAVRVSAAVNAGTRVGLFGSFEEGGTIVQVQAAIFGANAPGTAWSYATVDLNASPMPYYYIGIVAAADDSAKTLDLVVSE